MNLRPYVPADAEALAKLYRESIGGLGPQGYSPAQVAVWASFVDDVEAFGDKLSQGLTVLAEGEAGAIGFGQLEPFDHVEFLYCHPAHARKGVASAIYAWLEMFALQRGAAALTTEASRVSRPFFESMGFEVMEPEYVERSGVTFERFRMRKELT